MSGWLAESIDECSGPYDKARFEAGYAVVRSPKAQQWATLMDVPTEVTEVRDNQGRKWEREGSDWVTYSSFVQRWSTAVTDLSGWGPFSRRRYQ